MEYYLNNIEGGDVLFKLVLFVLVQGLVYLILSQSSEVFSAAKTPGGGGRSFSFKMARSISIRRMAAALADIPAGGDQEASPSSSSSPTKGKGFWDIIKEI